MVLLFFFTLLIIQDKLIQERIMIEDNLGDCSKLTLRRDSDITSEE
jgi:hypothetical protein